MKKQTTVICFLTVFCFLFMTWLSCQASDDNIYACKNNKTGTPRFVNGPNKCRKTEHLVTLTPEKASNDIVGHWSFMQYHDGTSGSVNPLSNPGVCVGDIEIQSDLTYTLWNSCRVGDNPDPFAESATGSGLQKGPGFYSFGSYTVLVSKSGDMALYSNLLSDHPGHYEHGVMLKDIVIDHDALLR